MFYHDIEYMWSPEFKLPKIRFVGKTCKRSIGFRNCPTRSFDLDCERSYCWECYKCYIWDKLFRVVEGAWHNWRLTSFLFRVLRKSSLISSFVWFHDVTMCANCLAKGTRVHDFLFCRVIILIYMNLFALNV